MGVANREIEGQFPQDWLIEIGQNKLPLGRF